MGKDIGITNDISKSYIDYLNKNNKLRKAFHDRISNGQIERAKELILSDTLLNINTKKYKYGIEFQGVLEALDIKNSDNKREKIKELYEAHLYSQIIDMK